MRNLKEKVAYLHGLTQGLNVNQNSAEGKLLVNIIDVLDSFAEEVNNVNLAQMELEEYVESIDEDLTDLEEEVYEEVMDEEYDDDMYDDLDDDMVEVACPHCHELVTFESDILDDDDAVEVTCPYCGDVVYDNTLDITEVTSGSTYGIRDSGHIMHPGV